MYRHIRPYQFAIQLCLLLWVSYAPLSQAQRANEAKIAVLPDIQADYHQFLGNRRPEDVVDYRGPKARRDVIELVLLQQALKLGGFTTPLKFVEEENYFRSIRNVMEGKTLTVSGTIWFEDLRLVHEKLYISPPLIEQGQFIVGVYTSPHNQRALASKSLVQLQQLRIVTSRQWAPDLKTLESLGFDKIMFTPNWVNMARMINAGRVDITLAPFELTDQRHIHVDGIRLVPIEGIKIAIEGSRHWPVSRMHPLGREFHEALKTGIEHMRTQGTIERAYRECGFFNEEMAGWKLLNPAAHKNTPQSENASRNDAQPFLDKPE